VRGKLADLELEDQLAAGREQSVQRRVRLLAPVKVFECLLHCLFKKKLLPRVPVVTWHTRLEQVRRTSFPVHLAVYQRRRDVERQVCLYQLC